MLIVSSLQRASRSSTEAKLHYTRCWPQRALIDSNKSRYGLNCHSDWTLAATISRPFGQSDGAILKRLSSSKSDRNRKKVGKWRSFGWGAPRVSTRPLSIGRSPGQSAEPLLLSWSSMRSRPDVATERDGGRKAENNEDGFENKEKNGGWTDVDRACFGARFDGDSKLAL